MPPKSYFYVQKKQGNDLAFIVVFFFLLLYANISDWSISRTIKYICNETTLSVSLRSHTLPTVLWTDGTSWKRCFLTDNITAFLSCFTLCPLVQTTVGAGSPVIGTSRRNLLPATTMMVESAVRPIQSRWILGGS